MVHAGGYVKQYLKPERNKDESLEDYKLRRMLGNKYANGTVEQRNSIRAMVDIKSWEAKYKGNTPR